MDLVMVEALWKVAEATGILVIITINLQVLDPRKEETWEAELWPLCGLRPTLCQTANPGGHGGPTSSSRYGSGRNDTQQERRAGEGTGGLQVTQTCELSQAQWGQGLAAAKKTYFRQYSCLWVKNLKTVFVTII